MKRSPELIPLSHDHHQALFVAQRLRRAADEVGAAGELLDFWKAYGHRHFEVEEGVLLPAWFELDPKADRVLAARVGDEHLAIRTAVRRGRASVSRLEDLRDLGKLLADHVRFEERQLFPLIEGGLNATPSQRSVVRSPWPRNREQQRCADRARRSSPGRRRRPTGTHAVGTRSMPVPMVPIGIG